MYSVPMPVCRCHFGAIAWRWAYITGPRPNMAEMFSYFCTKRSPVLMVSSTRAQPDVLHSVLRITLLTFPDESASDPFDEFEPLRVFHRLCQSHVAGPQTRLMRRRELPRGGHLERSARVPVTKLYPRTHDEHLDIRRFRSENDAEPE